MEKKHPVEPEYFVRFSDLAFFFKKYRNKLFILTMVCALLGMLYALTRPLEYEANASFRDKGKAPNPIASASLFLTGSGISNGGQAITLFKSRKLLSLLIQQMNLQAHVVPMRTSFPRWTAFQDKCRIELAYWFANPRPHLSTPVTDLQATYVKYGGEYSMAARIRFVTEEDFQVVCSEKGFHSQHGKLGMPLLFDGGQFTLERISNIPLTGQEYTIICEPMQDVVKRIGNQIIIELDKEDKTLVRLCCRSSNRYQAADLLNMLMRVYLDYLREEQIYLLTHQVDYLKQRQNEMESSLLQKVEANASSLSSELVLTGLPDAKAALELFTRMQQHYYQQILEIELVLKRLQQLQADGTLFLWDLSNNVKSMPTADGEQLQIHNLKHQIDLLNLSLRDKHGQVTETMEQLLTQLAHTHKAHTEAQTILTSIKTNTSIDPHLELLNDKHYRVGAWVDQLARAEKEEEQELYRSRFCSYLEHLMHLFNVDAKTIQERLTYQQETPKEFQGISLSTAKDLYLMYNKQLNGIETQILQREFLLEQIHEPHFEMSSLHAILDDAFSLEIISKVGNLTLLMQDEANRSPKEQERLRREISLNKNFIATHIEQSKQLLQVHEKLLRQKITGVQQTTLELLHREISTLENSHTDQMKAKIAALLQEKAIIEEHQSTLKKNMALLPERWISGKMIDYQMDLNKKMVEEITKLVESKNIERNLEIVQSTPIDYAFPQMLPRPPRIILFGLLGGAMGILLSIGVLMTQAIFKGIPIYPGSLQQTRCHVAGTLSTHYFRNGHSPLLRDDDLATFRQIVAFLTESATTTQQTTALILHARKIPFYKDLAMMMAKRGLRVLLIPLFFDQKSEGIGPGLLQYLEGTAETPEIIKKENYDILSEGGISRFALEKLGHLRFKHLLQQLCEKYDWVIGLSNFPPNSAEADTLIPLFGQILIPITQERWQDITDFIHRHPQPISCILSEERS